MDTHQSRTGSSLDQALMTFRVIGFSLGLGVTLFALVSWFLHLENGPAPADLDPALMFNIALGAALLASVAAILFWRSRVAPLIEEPAAGDDPGRRLEEIQTRVIIAWALIEGAALLAVVVYFLFGNILAGALGVGLIWVAIGLTWPKREWLGPPSRSA